MRYTRHELKQDKFAESAAEAVHEVVEHRSDIIRIAIVVVVIAALLGGAFLYYQSREQAAADALGQAMVSYNAPVVLPNTPPQGSILTFHSDPERLIAAKKQFYSVSDKYGWTKAGAFAHYMAGSCEQELGNNAIAEKQLEAVTHSRFGEVAALAKYALASVYRAENRDQDAINQLQQLINKPAASVPKATAQLALADVYIAEHQPDKAKVILDEVAKENANNPLSEIAKSREAGLK